MTVAPAPLERTPDRPGPGPLPENLLRALDLTIGRRIEGMLAGDHRSSVLGQGSELAQVRPYVPGDDVRRIEWNVTARTGETHVRVDLAERVLVTWLALDVSASMSFGTAERRKADVAEGVALALGHLASRRGNRIFADTGVNITKLPTSAANTTHNCQGVRAPHAADTPSAASPSSPHSAIPVTYVTSTLAA